MTENFTLSATGQCVQFIINTHLSESDVDQDTYNSLLPHMSKYYEELLEARKLSSTTEWFNHNSKKFLEEDGTLSNIPIIDVSSGTTVDSSNNIKTILQTHEWDLLASTILLNPPFLGLHLLVKKRI